MSSDEITLLERDEPRARLEAALAAARRGRGRVLSLEGEAGIGKTALTFAFTEAHRTDARVHMGGCEHLATPEPLGPLRDIARESQGRFALPATGQLGAYEALLRLLTHGRGPALLVIEDIHWADDATLDLIRYLGRRVRTAPILVVVTFRNDETASSARLASLWADMPRDGRERVELSPLSLDAVSALANPAGRVGRDIFEVTGGNPFHVTEYLATDGEGVPRSVGEATLARAAVLSRRGRRTLDWAAIFPRQIDEETLRILADDPEHLGVEEALRSGMLMARAGVLAFRHELARRAVEDAISPLRRRELHAAALALLKGRNRGAAAEAAHHAGEAGAPEDLVEFSIRAADEASALGAYRQAVTHLATALAHGDWLTDAERAVLLERQAEAGDRCGAFGEAMQAIEEAVAAHRRIGDALGLGNALRIASRLRWQHGESDRADRYAQEALATLAGHTGAWQHAMAVAGQAQLDMLSDRNITAIGRGLEAMRLADRLGRDDIHLHALTSVALARAMVDPDEGLAQMGAAIDEARRRGQIDAIPRLAGSMTRIMAHVRRYAGLFEAIQTGLDAAVARDNRPLEAYLHGVRAQALLDLGRSEEAVVEAENVAFGPYPRGVVRFPALMALSRARVRLDLPEGGVLDELRAAPTASRDNMRLAPIAVADAEAAWLGLPRPGALERLRAARDRVLRAWSQPWLLAETTLWLVILGEPAGLPDDLLASLPEAHRLHITGRWSEAALAWQALGCPYEQAVALSTGDEPAQREALILFDRLGAAPAARKLRREMRVRGVRAVPAAPRAARRNDPAGLTPRQSEVLGLLAEGLSNLEIAGRLGASAKTVEHHVGAILAALEAPSRLRAVQIARERGVFDPQPV